MPFELELAALYLFSARGRGHRSRLVKVTALGLAFGAFALVVSLALLAGFQEAVRSEMRAASPGVVVRPRAGASDAERVALTQRLTPLGTVEARRRRLVWALHPAANASAGVTLIEDSRLAPRSVVVDPAASRELGAVPGAQLELVVARTELTPFGPVPRSLPVEITGFEPTGAPRERGRLLVATDVLDVLYGAGPPDEMVLLARAGTDPSGLLAAAQAAVAGLGADVGFGDASQEALGAALELERLVLFAAIALVVAVAAGGVATDLALLAVERRSGTAILHAQGLSRRRIRRLYMAVAALVGLVGGSVGALVGAISAWLVDRQHWIPLPDGLYTIDRLPFRVEVHDVLAAIGLTLALALAAAWLPARRAALEVGAAALRER